MSDMKHGRVKVELPASIKLPERAGKMSKLDVARLLKAPHWLWLASEHAAVVLEKLGSSFTAPAGITPESLRDKGGQSQEMALLIQELEAVVSKLKQGKLLIDHETHLQLRKLKDRVRTEAKYNHLLKVFFAHLLSCFDEPATTRKANRSKKASRIAAEAVVETSQGTHDTSERPPLNLVKLPETAS